MDLDVLLTVPYLLRWHVSWLFRMFFGVGLGLTEALHLGRVG